MSNVTLLDNIAHADLSVTRRSGAAFGDAVNQTLIFPTEVEAAQREFPILIQRDEEGAWQLVALLGFDRDENLFLSGEIWSSHYIPAVHRRGPFLIGMHSRDGGEEPMIHIDLDDPRVGRNDTEGGEPLFLPHGGNGPYLDHVAQTLRDIHEGRDLMAPMFAAFEDAGLIRPVKLDIQIDETRQYGIGNHFVIDGERLAMLDAQTLHDLNHAGFLGLAFAILTSLGNIERLIARKRDRLDD